MVSAVLFSAYPIVANFLKSTRYPRWYAVDSTSQFNSYTIGPTEDIIMSAPIRSIETTTAWPKTLRHCRACGKETPHQIRQGAGVVVTLCVPCLERALTYELDRD